MNNVQFITWKPIYWIQHLALSPLHLFFNTSAKKKEIKAEFNSQSHFWIVFCQGNPCCKHIFLSKKIVITTTTFTYLQLKARFVLEPVCLLLLGVYVILLLILPCHGHIQGHTFLVLTNLISIQRSQHEMINKNNLDNNYSKTSLTSKTHNNRAGKQQWIQVSGTLLP